MFTRHSKTLAALCGLCLSSAALAAERPNILWITSEDNGKEWIGCYGSKNAKTPNIDRLAKEGFRYTHCFDNAAVCAPTRSMWITGMYPVSMGTQPMRSRNGIPHDRIPYYPDLLRRAGYHTSNYVKTDYNTAGRSDSDCWDVHIPKGSSGNARYGWKLRESGQPFFCVVNFMESHESRAHGIKDTKALAYTKPREYSTDPAKMELFAYHPDLPAVRQSYARYADGIADMDAKVGATIEALKADGLYEDTVIIYNSDHGGVMPRSKRFLYSSGIHCPLVVRIPDKWRHLWPAARPGQPVDRLVSFIDMPKTWLSLAGAEIPETFQGTIFLGAQTEPEPVYHFAFRERADARCDMVRMIRDKRYAYHRNYMPYAPAGHYLQTMWRIPLASAWEEHNREGKTDAITGRFFRPRVSEEFYDNVEDYDNVHNLIDAPEHEALIATLRKELRKRQLELFDSGLLPESLREKRAAENNCTIYEMVRNADLYPLADYLDAADMALERNQTHLDTFVADMSHADSCRRYWAVVGLHLLGAGARSAADVLEAALADAEDEVVIMAAWTLVKLGHREKALERLQRMIEQSTTALGKLNNVIDWMDEDGRTLVEACIKHFEETGKVRDKGRVIEKCASELGLAWNFDPPPGKKRKQRK